MNPNALQMRVLPHRLALCQLPRSCDVPAWCADAEFCAVTWTPKELSVICDETVVPADVQTDKTWRVIEILGPLPPELTGVIAAFSRTLADAAVSIAVISSSTTDYIVVQDSKLDVAVAALRTAGHTLDAT
jgi:hypothetical protein